MKRHLSVQSTLTPALNVVIAPVLNAMDQGSVCGFLHAGRVMGAGESATTLILTKIVPTAERRISLKFLENRF